MVNYRPLIKFRFTPRLPDQIAHSTGIQPHNAKITHSDIWNSIILEDIKVLTEKECEFYNLGGINFYSDEEIVKQKKKAAEAAKKKGRK